MSSNNNCSSSSSEEKAAIVAAIEEDDFEDCNGSLGDNEEIYIGSEINCNETRAVVSPLTKDDDKYDDRLITVSTTAGINGRSIGDDRVVERSSSVDAVPGSRGAEASHLSGGDVPLPSQGRVSAAMLEMSTVTHAPHSKRYERAAAANVPFAGPNFLSSPSCETAVVSAAAAAPDASMGAITLSICDMDQRLNSTMSGTGRRRWGNTTTTTGGSLRKGERVMHIVRAGTLSKRSRGLLGSNRPTSMWLMRYVALVVDRCQGHQTRHDLSPTAVTVARPTSSPLPPPSHSPPPLTESEFEDALEEEE